MESEDVKDPVVSPVQPVPLARRVKWESPDFPDTPEEPDRRDALDRKVPPDGQV